MFFKKGFLRILFSSVVITSFVFSIIFPSLEPMFTFAEGIDSDVISLLHFDSNLTDESGRSWSNPGSANYDVSDKKFGIASYNAPDVQITHATDPTDFNAIGTGDFTFDFWIKLTSSIVSQRIIDHIGGCGDLSSTNSWFIGTEGSTPKISLLRGSGSSYDFIGLNTPASSMVGSWHHVAFVRSSGVVKVYLDGVMETSNSYTNDFSGNTAPVIIGGASGCVPNSANYRLDELRVSKIARWTSNFTPPTESYSSGDSSPSGISSQITTKQQILSELSMTVASTSITMLPAIPGLTGGAGYGETDVNIVTNNTTGYTVTLSASSTGGTMVGDVIGYAIPAYSPTDGIPTTWASPTSGGTALFGFAVEAVSSETESGSLWNGKNDNLYFTSATSGPITILKRNTHTTYDGATSTLHFRVEVPPNPNPAVPEDWYTATTTLTATMN